jgi:Neuraminidase (sialidase)
MLANYGGTADSEEQQVVDPKVDKKRKKEDAAATKVSFLSFTSRTKELLKNYRNLVNGQNDWASL